MGYQLLNVLVFTLVGILFVVGTVEVVGRLLRPRVKSPAEPAKEETYECGEPAVGSSWVRFDIRFYTVALIFLIFDVEVTFLYPWALVFDALRLERLGLFVFGEVFLFLAILGVGFIYCWKKGDLDWVKTQPGKAFPEARVAAKEPRRKTPEAVAEKAPSREAKPEPALSP
jgi:NADH-quinone oxidoreductase subunit A